MKKFRLPLDLQFFAEESTDEPSEEIVPAEETVEETVEEPKYENPLFSGKTIAEQQEARNAIKPEEDEEPAEPEEPAVEELDWAGRKVKVTDPVIKDLHKDYSSLNSEYTKSQQRVKDLEAQLKEQPKEPETKDETATEERMQEINEKYLEMLYDNPVKAFVWLNEQPEFQEAMQPFQQKNVESAMTATQKRDQDHQTKINSARTTVMEKYSDYGDLVPDMQNVIDQYPSIAEQMVKNPNSEVFESVYLMAKGMKEPGKSITEESLLADPEFIKKMTSDEKIKTAIIKNYVDGVNGKQKQTPHVIGNDSGGQPPALPENKPRNIKEAGKLAREFFSRNNG